MNSGGWGINWIVKIGTNEQGKMNMMNRMNGVMMIEKIKH